VQSTGHGGKRDANSTTLRATWTDPSRKENLQYLWSTGGTRVNGERIERAVLRAWDRLVLAEYFEFEVIERGRRGY